MSFEIKMTNPFNMQVEDEQRPTLDDKLDQAVRVFGEKAISKIQQKTNLNQAKETLSSNISEVTSKIGNGIVKLGLWLGTYTETAPGELPVRVDPKHSNNDENL